MLWVATLCVECSESLSLYKKVLLCVVYGDAQVFVLYYNLYTDVLIVSSMVYFKP